MRKIFRLHGLPKAIVSNRDTKFTYNFRKRIFVDLGTQLNFSVAYHPQIERVNQERRQISSLQLKKCFKKGCQLYVAYILDSSDVFLDDEMIWLPPKRDNYSTIDIVPTISLVSETLYKMSTPQLLELKMQL
jgi:hypothetical protein